MREVAGEKRKDVYACTYTTRDDEEMFTQSGTHLHLLLFFPTTEAHARADLSHREEDGT